MEMELQFSRLRPMESPCLGALVNSEGREYLSGEGEWLFLHGATLTCRFRPYDRIQKRVIAYQTWVPFHRIDG